MYNPLEIYDTLVHIFKFLDINDAKICLLVNKSWYYNINIIIKNTLRFKYGDFPLTNQSDQFYILKNYHWKFDLLKKLFRLSNDKLFDIFKEKNGDVIDVILSYNPLNINSIDMIFIKSEVNVSDLILYLTLYFYNYNVVNAFVFIGGCLYSYKLANDTLILSRLYNLLEDYSLSYLNKTFNDHQNIILIGLITINNKSKWDVDIKNYISSDTKDKNKDFFSKISKCNKLTNSYSY